MNFIIRFGLPIISVHLVYQDKRVLIENVLLDTGCAVSIFDADAVESTGIKIDPKNDIIRRMYGIGGQSELCYEKTIKGLQICDIYFSTFNLQLGMTRVPYGFDGILGTDFFHKTKSIIDFNNLTIHFNED